MILATITRKTHQNLLTIGTSPDAQRLYENLKDLNQSILETSEIKELAFTFGMQVLVPLNDSNPENPSKRQRVG